MMRREGPEERHPPKASCCAALHHGDDLAAKNLKIYLISGSFITPAGGITSRGFLIPPMVADGLEKYSADAIV
ncbi:hypothetical protein [Agrobacterium pusense]|uniref:hypothetical protein n=1 Tax=Agrobacterium pusense TaxID=648995 RepID=UPI003FCFF3DE